ncbi:MAG: UbiA family prenyltransferase [Pyrinomonadaceae bacterium]
MRNKIPQIASASRGREWWEFKIAPIFGSVYATAIVLDIHLISLLYFLPFILIALIPGAVYVSVINDFTDLEVDEKAGKKNRLQGQSKSLVFVTIFLCVAIGVAVGFFLNPVSLIFYLGAWIAYSLYSLPPVRLKVRGFSGVLADALGANVFPQLFAVALLTEWFQKEWNLLWFIALGSWSLFWGIRGIVWHQLTDLVNDERSGVNTFARRHSAAFVRRSVLWVVFPLELVSLLMILILIGSFLPAAFVLIYLLIEYARCALLEIDLIVVKPAARYKVFLEEYYGFFYPISLIVLGSLSNPNSLIVLIFQLVLFPKRIYDLVCEIPGISKRGFYAFREFLLGY